MTSASAALWEHARRHNHAGAQRERRAHSCGGYRRRVFAAAILAAVEHATAKPMLPPQDSSSSFGVAMTIVFIFLVLQVPPHSSSSKSYENKTYRSYPEKNEKILPHFPWILLALLAAGTFFFLWQNSRPRHDRYESVVPAFDTIERTTVLTAPSSLATKFRSRPRYPHNRGNRRRARDQVRIGDIIARIKVVPEASQLSSAQSRLSVASIELNEKETTFRRDSVLYSRQVISRQEFETSLNARARAREEVDAAEDALAIVREGVSRYNATESNTLVRATVDGLVLDVPVQVGSSVIQANTLNDGTTVAVIANMSDLIFRGKVDETEVASASRPACLSHNHRGSNPELEAHSQIEYIAPKGDNSSGANTFEIKAAIPAENTAGMRSATAPTPP